MDRAGGRGPRRDVRWYAISEKSDTEPDAVPVRMRIPPNGIEDKRVSLLLTPLGGGFGSQDGSP